MWSCEVRQSELHGICLHQSEVYGVRELGTTSGIDHTLWTQSRMHIVKPSLSRNGAGVFNTLKTMQKYPNIQSNLARIIIFHLRRIATTHYVRLSLNREICPLGTITTGILLRDIGFLENS